jgi:hypothetical protein
MKKIFGFNLKAIYITYSSELVFDPGANPTTFEFTTTTPAL